MLNPEDRKAIEGLFERIEDVERQAGPRDAEAQALIESKTKGHPAAPYYMAQTILMQELALNQAEQRLAELERQLAERPAGSGGLFGGLFGGDRSPPARTPAAPRQAAPIERQDDPAERGPWGNQARRGSGFGGGGFLAGAAQTAMGVAGGVLLGNAIAGMLSPDQANAAEDVPPEEDPAQDDYAADDAGADDFGGDFGDDF